MICRAFCSESCRKRKEVSAGKGYDQSERAGLTIIVRERENA